MSPTAPQQIPEQDTEIRRLNRRIEELEEELQRLRRQEGDLRGLIDSMPMGVALLDGDCRYTAVNEALAALHGIPPEEHTGRPADEVVPFLADQIRASVRRVVEAGRAFEEEVAAGTVIEPGRAGHWSITWFPLTGPDGRPAGAGAVVNDITARKQVEQALRDSQAALAESNRTIRRQVGEIEGLYSVSRAAVALFDPEFRFVRLNRSAAEINGVSVEDSIGRPLAEVLPELWPTLEPILRRVVETRRGVYGVEVRGETEADPGVEKVWLADYDAVCDGDGQFLGVSAFVTDVTDKVRVQEALQEAAARAQRQLAEIEAIYASAPTALCVYDGQLRFVRVNRRLAEINGLPPEAHIGKTPSEVAPDFGAQAEAALRRVLEGGEPLLDFEMAGRAPTGGETRYWNNRWVPLKDADGRVIGVSVAFEEITARRKAEESLRESERLYRAIGESIEYGVWVCAPDGRCTYASDSFLKMLGITAEQCRDFGWIDKLHPDDRERTLAAWQEATRTALTWDVEHRFMGQDGRYHAVLARGAPVRNERGEVICWAGINLDISALKAAEESLRQSEARERARAAELEAIMDAVPIGICIARDGEGRQITANRMASRLLRVPPGANVSKAAPGSVPHLRVLRDGREVPLEELPVQIACRTGREVHGAELEFVFEDGESRHVISNAVPLLDAEGRPYGALCAFVDVTERKRSEERLRHAQKLESIGLLAGGIAHDFNNLLVGVIGNASLAHEMLPPEHPCAPLIEEVVSTGERAAHLTRQMLAYAGKGRFLIEPLHLSSVVEEMQDLMRPAIPGKARVRFELAAELPQIDADRGQIQQVFMNLIINAAEAIGDQPGTITIRTGAQWIPAGPPSAEIMIGEPRAGSHVFLEVQDTGCGMDEATKSRIFEPFYSTKFTGRGLGLAATAGVVSSHHGALRVVSAPGAGSTFTIYFPAAGAAEDPGERGGPAAERRRGAVLVIDDERTVRDLAERCLERGGFNVLPAGSGDEALEIFRRRHHECVLIVLDLSMPGMSGHETLPELLRIRADVPVVVSSGYSESETMRMLDGQRVAAFLQKPYTSRRLMELVARMVDGAPAD